MKKTTMNIRVDVQLKKKAENIVHQLGISMSSAIALYLGAIVREKGIPFSVTLEPKKKGSAQRLGSDKELTLEPNDEGLIDEASIKKAIEKF